MLILFNLRLDKALSGKRMTLGWEGQVEFCAKLRPLRL
jgi:hypothetical protein